jgi:hypothetical protein
MKIEQEILHFDPSFKGLQSLTDLQKLYLQILQGGKSIEGVVAHFLHQGWLVNFAELADLIEMIVEAKAIRNPSFEQYINRMKPVSEKSLWNTIINLDLDQSPIVSARSYKELPFFRNLEQKFADYLLSKATVHQNESKY